MGCFTPMTEEQKKNRNAMDSIVSRMKADPAGFMNSYVNDIRKGNLV
jgi:hypothetical protein